MTDNQITQILTYLLIFMIFVLISLFIAFIYVKAKDNKRKKEENKNDIIGGGSGDTQRNFKHSNTWIQQTINIKIYGI